MANPQIEDGYTKIANEILEALSKIRIPGEARQVLDVIIRKTYGFNKKEDAISLSQFNLATGIVKPSVVRAINQLIEMNLISKNANGLITTYRFIKDYSAWKPLAKKLTVNKKANDHLQKSKSALAKKLHTKETITKETITKEIGNKRKNGKFKKPTLEEVEGYCRERNNGIDAQHFIDKNESIGWVVGKNRTPMKCWQSTIRTWERMNRLNPPLLQSLKPIKCAYDSNKTCYYDCAKCDIAIKHRGKT